MISSVVRMALLAGFALGACVTGAARAQTSAEIASYTGPDRTARLIEGAKKEGGFTLYSSATTEDMGEIILFVATRPKHIVLNEMVIGPTWNRGYVASNTRI